MKVFKSSLLIAVALTLSAGLNSIQGAQAQAPDTLKQVQPNDEMLKKGGDLFKANCASCHGDQGKGDGLAAAALTPKPRNFHGTGDWKNGQAFTGLWKTLEEGIPGSAMGAFNHLPATNRVAIINHIRSLAKANYPEITSADVETLNKDYNFAEQLTKGAAAAIPVDKAIELLIAEDAPNQARVKAAMAKMGDKQIDGVTNPERALTMLVRAGNGWRGNAQDFSRMVMYNSEVNGFRAMSGGYTSSQWQGLHKALTNLL